jgi:hypothetical protein
MEKQPKFRSVRYEFFPSFVSIGISSQEYVHFHPLTKKVNAGALGDCPGQTHLDFPADML